MQHEGVAVWHGWRGKTHGVTEGAPEKLVFERNWEWGRSGHVFSLSGWRPWKETLRAMLGTGVAKNSGQSEEWQCVGAVCVIDPSSPAPYNPLPSMT